MPSTVKLQGHRYSTGIVISARGMSYILEHTTWHGMPMLECLSVTLLALNLVSASWDHMHPFMPFFQCYDWVQNASPKLLCFMCFWGLLKISCLSIESKKSTQQHDTVRKAFLYYSAGAEEECASTLCSPQQFSHEFVYTLHYETLWIAPPSPVHSGLSIVCSHSSFSGLFLCWGS